MQADLIFDLGLHNGADSVFYLKKGFRVVGVEANPELCAAARETFADAIAGGAFVLVNKAVAAAPGRVTFYKNTADSVWGTIDPDFAARNRRLGTANVTCDVEATTVDALIAAFGVPYYMKVDIEGLDLVAVDGLRANGDRPKFVSLESDKVSMRALRREFEVLRELGYDRFKIVPQHSVERQSSPDPAREGRAAAHQFARGASGLFGEEAPGEWLTAEDAIEAYRPIFLRYALTGDDPFVRSRTLRRILNRIGFRSGWYDTHAKRDG